MTRESRPHIFHCATFLPTSPRTLKSKKAEAMQLTDAAQDISTANGIKTDGLTSDRNQSQSGESPDPS